MRYFGAMTDGARRSLGFYSPRRAFDINYVSPSVKRPRVPAAAFSRASSFRDRRCRLLWSTRCETTVLQQAVASLASERGENWRRR